MIVVPAFHLTAPSRHVGVPVGVLAVQVHSVLQPLCTASGLRLGLAAAQKSLAIEAASITSPPPLLQGVVVGGHFTPLGT